MTFDTTTDNGLNQISDFIWTQLNTIENSNLNRKQQTELVKSTIIDVVSSARTTGRRQVLNHFKSEINNLEV